MNSPFLLENQAEYEAWKKIKLSSYPKSLSDLCVKIDQNNFGQTNIIIFKKSDTSVLIISPCTND